MAYYDNIFQFGIGGLILKCGSQCMAIGRAVDIITTNQAYDEYTNYPHVIQQYKARILLQQKIKDNLNNFNLNLD